MAKADLEEEWRDIAGYEGLYQVSDQGRVKSLYDGRRNIYRERILKAIKHSDEYLRVTLYKNNIRKNFLVHQLVAKEFLDNPEEKPYIDHINTIRDDNRVQNLRWCTQKENCNNQLSLDKYSESNKGDKNPMYGKHLSEETKKKMSEAKKGEKNPFYGRIHSEETKKKMSDAHCKTVYMLDNESGEILNVFKSTCEAGRITGISQASISLCCSGKRKSAGGYKFEYLF